MARKKIKLMFIVNDNARKASYRKRRAGLIKKLNELTILCGVSAFIIIYSPDDPEPLIWPSKSVVERMMDHYWGLSEMERTKKMLNQQRYLKERVMKFEEQVRKQDKKIREMELGILMHKMQQDRDGAGLGSEDLLSLLWLVDAKMNEITDRVNYFQRLPPLNYDTIPTAVPVDPPVLHPASAASIQGHWLGRLVGGSSTAGNLTARCALGSMPNYGGADRFDLGLQQPDPASLGAVVGGCHGGGIPCGGLGQSLDGAGTSDGGVGGLGGYYGGGLSDPYGLNNVFPYPPPQPPICYHFYR